MVSVCCSAVLSHFKDSKYQLGIGLFQFSEEKLLSLEALIVYLKIPSVILSWKELQLDWGDLKYTIIGKILEKTLRGTILLLMIRFQDYILIKLLQFKVE